jgi:hypothetical protein
MQSGFLLDVWLEDQLRFDHCDIICS